jgi:hypothetical protein
MEILLSADKASEALASLGHRQIASRLISAEHHNREPCMFNDRIGQAIVLSKMEWRASAKRRLS